MRSTSILAAVLLCVVVLSSFFVLRNYGPESTVRRFHFSVLRNDQATLRSLCIGEDTAVFALANKVKRLYADKAQITLGRVNDDDPNHVVAQFIYRTKDYVYTIIWVLEHKRNGWMIDASATLNGPIYMQQRSQMQGMPQGQ
jgi:hypothetical protein